MKLLLTAINAKYIHSNLAVYSLKAYAKEYSCNIQIAEYTINHRTEDILQEIYKENPEVLCFSCYIWNYDYVKEIAAEYHKLRPEVPIWVGGPEVSYEVEEVFGENPAFFGVMIGEGEETFAKLCEHYFGKIELKDIKGLAYRHEGNVVKTALRTPIHMDELPFCYEKIEDFKNRIIYYESSRGCPFSCSYCLSSVDKQLRFKSIELVKKELGYLIEKKVPQVKFVDRTFNCNREHAMAIWGFIKEKDLGNTNFHFEIAADLLDEEEIAFLSELRPGLMQFEIGVQSTNQDTIQEIRRVMSLSEVSKKVEKIRKAQNIHQHLDLIVGLPLENYVRFQQSFRDVYHMKPQQLQLGFLKVLKGSYMYEKREEYHITYRQHPPYEVLETKWITYDQVIKLKLVEEMVEVYYNSRQFEITTPLMEVLYPDIFSFFLKLGEYYDAKGYLKMNHSRIRRCEILLEFLAEEKKEPSELFEEALLFDLYYRENAKSRPSWGADLRSFSGMTRRFCKKGKLSHLEPFHFDFHAHTITDETTIKLPQRLEEPIYILFDYEQRNPLTHQAAVRKVTEEGEIHE